MTAIRFFIISFFIFDISIGLTQTKQEKGVEYNNLEEALKNPNKVYRLNLGNQKNLPKKFDLSVFKNLEFLSFENNNLEEIPLGLTNLKNLKTLNLSGNLFKELPEDINKLKNLETIYLNREKNLNLTNAIVILGKLPGLKNLHLESDNLKSLPAEILVLKKLEYLNLNNNQLNEIPKLDNLDHLKFLDMRKNQISPDLLDQRNLNFGFKIILE
ncbi:MAG: leucine-rich repeat domain-containing protein [Flavobacterium sp.]|nr:leucine-rich repeat domain-containing protein [Flavobacterium sp.]MBP7319140.1 leucine-rich repeat domain-containing protein [Flavobacterium sp.]